MSIRSSSSRYVALRKKYGPAGAISMLLGSLWAVPPLFIFLCGTTMEIGFRAPRDAGAFNIVRTIELAGLVICAVIIFYRAWRGAQAGVGSVQVSCDTR